MGNILVTFDDGTTDLRAAESPCLLCFDDERLRSPAEAKWYLEFPATPHDPAQWTFCGFIINHIALRRGRGVWLWVETAGRSRGAPLLGEWMRARVETQDEQIERLTRERNDERRERVEARGVLSAIRERAEREIAATREMFEGVRGCDPGRAADGA